MVCLTCLYANSKRLPLYNEHMILETFPVGPLQCNCTLMGDEETREAIVIDPGDEVSRIHRRLTEHGLKLRQILITHAHIDHVGGALKLKSLTGAPIYLNTNDSTRHLNPAAFATPAPGFMGSLGKGAVRGTPITTVDFSVAKNWRFKERYGFQFRAEMFNALNHTNFGRTDAYQNNLNFQGNTTLSNFGKPTNGGFGTIGRAADPREIQFGFKFTF